MTIAGLQAFATALGDIAQAFIDIATNGPAAKTAVQDFLTVIPS